MPAVSVAGGVMSGLGVAYAAALGVGLVLIRGDGLAGFVALLFVAYLATVALRGRMTKDG